MSRRALAAASTLWLVFGSACSFTYTEVGKAVPDPSGLEIGVSTAGDVLAELGPPRVVRKQFDGELFTYRRLERKDRSLTILPIFVRLLYVGSGERRRDDVTLLFDRDGVLRAIGTRLESEEPEEGKPSSFVGAMLRSLGDFAYRLVH
ncbi:MAG: hypothetical protein JRG76_10330 [Deltaproteobacteria bacterium]|nr:hypothetical protein [Deltaproteobacteria bacterium]MBW2414893.1 hypothetical protein [Deltaproteobacteria bacterium]